MKKLFILFIIGLLTSFLTSCGNDNEDKVKSINKDGAISVQLSVKHLADKDVLISEYEIWNKNNLVKKYAIYDTVPNLGMVKSEIDSTDANENAVSVMVPKDYEFYVTLK